MNCQILKIRFDTLFKLSPKETICMKCQILFRRKKKKKNSISLLFAEFAHSMVSVNEHSSNFQCLT